MKTKILAVSVLGMIASTQAFAGKGGHSGNGGGAHYCVETRNGVKNETYETYDLWEGRNPLRPKVTVPLKIPKWDGKTTKQEYLQQAILKIAAVKPKLALLLEKTLALYQSNVEDGGHLVSVDDAHLFRVSPNCSYVQLVNWIDDKKVLEWYGEKKEVILRDDSIYNHLDPLHQAANDFHEAVYKVRRFFELDQDHSGSVYVRRFVAQAFSDSPIQEDLYRNISKDKETKAPYEVTYWLDKKCTQAELDQASLTIENKSGKNVFLSHVHENPAADRDFKLEAGQTTVEDSETGSEFYADVYQNDYRYQHFGMSRFSFGVSPSYPAGVQESDYPFLLGLKVKACGQEIQLDDLKVDYIYRENAYVTINVLSSPL